jgi:hypothetical protein
LANKDINGRASTSGAKDEFLFAATAQNLRRLDSIIPFPHTSHGTRMAGKERCGAFHVRNDPPGSARV